jgi:hypothetical protein
MEGNDRDPWKWTHPSNVDAPELDGHRGQSSLPLTQSPTDGQLFPPDTFLRDFQILADVLGHEYIVVVSLSSPWYEG